MSADFVKFPTTPHLFWLGKSAPRNDKVIAPNEAKAFLRMPISIEEKVDGANLGISFSPSGNPSVQNRGHFVERGTKGQFAPMWAWLSEHETQLFEALEDNLILFGEWCYAQHSIHYTQLPDWFLAFDVFDRKEQRFMSIKRRNKLVDQLRLFSVPTIKSGIITPSEVPQLIGKSSFYDGPMEGIYLRHENDSWLIQRAKVVRPQFVQQISEHWSKLPLVPNQLFQNFVSR